MDWYYADGKSKVGPISTEELQSLVKNKKINMETLVWRQGMKDWEELGKIAKQKKAALNNCRRLIQGRRYALNAARHFPKMR